QISFRAFDSLRSCSLAPPFCGNAVSRRFLCVSRIVGRIHVIDLPRADTVKLNYRNTFRPPRVFHSGGPVTEGPCRKFFCALAIKRFAGREIKRTRNHRDALSFWMGMWCDMIAVRKLETHYERTFLRWIAFEHSHLCARRQGGWPRFPFNGFTRVKTHVRGLR